MTKICPPCFVICDILTYRRDLAAFFAHVIQETGENNGHFYQDKTLSKEDVSIYLRPVYCSGAGLLALDRGAVATGPIT